MSPEVKADFVERFGAYWRAPSRDGLDSLLAPEVRLVAPFTPTTVGLAASKRAFARVLALAPDLSAEVHRWGETADGVLIEFTLSGSVGGSPLSWDAVDSIALRDDGLATERISYFDSGPLALALMRRPRAWPALVRSRLGR